MNELSVVRRRMAAQGLTSAGLASPADVVRHLGAVQAQEFAEAKWSLAERTDGEPTDAEIEASFNRGEIIRTHVLRPTWHFVAPEDLRWMLKLTAPRAHQANRYWYAQVGLNDDLLRRGCAVIAEAMAGGEPLLRKEVGVALAGAGIEVEGSALGYMTHFAELEGLICSGPRRGRQATYALIEDRVPPAPELDPEAALTELTRRYVTGHGPATARDLSWWSGLTVTDARRGFQSLAGELHREVAEDGTAWFSTDASDPAAKSGAHLIPMYDELGVAFQDLRMVYAEPPPEGVMARPILIDGVTVGSWKRVLERRSVRVEATLFTKLASAQRDALDQTVERFGRFLGLDAELETRRVSA